MLRSDVENTVRTAISGYIHPAVEAMLDPVVQEAIQKSVDKIMTVVDDYSNEILKTVRAIDDNRDKD